MIGLKYIRKQNFMTLQEIANIIKVSKQTIGKWENEISVIPKDRIKQLSELFNIEEECLTENINNEIIKQKIDKMNMINKNNSKPIIKEIIKEVVPENAIIIDEKHRKLYDRFEVLVKNIDLKVLEQLLNNLIKMTNKEEEL